MLERDHTQIHRLQLRGPKQALERVNRSLQQAEWPQAPGESYVLVRRIQARAPGNRLAAEVLQQARHCVAAESDPDNVVRFADLAALVASLLTDLARGRAAQRWYWRRWSHLFARPAGQACASVLAEHLPLLPTLTRRLGQRQTLPLVWRCLRAEDAVTVLAELQVRQDYRVALPADRLTDGNDGAAPAPESGGATLPPALRQYWQPVLAALPPTDPRRRLALAVVAQSWRPLMLWQAPEQALQAVARSLAPAPPVDFQHSRAPTHASPPAAPVSATPVPLTDPEPAAEPAPAGRYPPPAREGQPPVGARSFTNGTTTEASTPQEPPQSVPVMSQPDQHPSHPDPIRVEPASIPSAEPAPASPHRQLRVAPVTTVTTPDPSADSQWLETGQGGLLYLLNFLNRPPLQQIMQCHWAALPHGWLWLLRLGQTLDLDHTDPLCRFILLDLGLEDSHQLAQFPPLPAAREIASLARQWYEPQAVWQPNLLRLPARIHHTPSHLDLHAAPQQVRMPVRLAGLDINPGWLPWLGRVVQFHYDL